MKQAEVVVGETYLTKINGGLVRVRVLGPRTVNGRKAYRVARPDSSREMTRTAAALREIPALRIKAGFTDDQLRHFAAHGSPIAAAACTKELERRHAGDCEYELVVNGRSVARCAKPTPMDEAVARAQAMATERGETVRLYFGGKSYDLEPGAAGPGAGPAEHTCCTACRAGGEGLPAKDMDGSAFRCGCECEACWREDAADQAS